MAIRFTARSNQVTRKDFQLLSDKRLKEARTLFRAKLYEGSYHIGGIAIECALKACIARQTHRFEFPDKNRANESFDHNLSKLLKVAGLQAQLEQAISDPVFLANWTIVKNWRVESRYTVTVKRGEADLLLNSITNPSQGVMPWLHIHW